MLHLAPKLPGEQVRFFHEHALVKEPGTSEITPWHHDEPYYCREIKQLEPQLMARRMLQNVADTHIKIRNDLT